MRHWLEPSWRKPVRLDFIAAPIALDIEFATRGAEDIAMVAQAQQLQEKARQCRELADTAMTDEARIVLQEMALKYEREASEATALPERASLAEAIV